MADRSAPRGYLDDVAYPATYLRELSPAWLDYAAVINGAQPRAPTGHFRYLELGCGQALSTVVHAAAFPQAEFHACDFNPACMASARRRAAEVAVGNVVFHETSFAELGAADLPSFDFVVAHGVYSWVDEAAREAIRGLIDARLAPAGLAYLTYNCLPGWAVETPLRRLLNELAAPSIGDAALRAQAAAGTLHRLARGSLAYFRVNPEASAAVDAYRQSPAGYLAHEFLNGTWAPMYSVDVADEMAGIGLELLGSATLADNHEPLLVDEGTARAVASLATPRQRQLAMDFAVNRRFRRDLFARSAAPGSAGGFRAVTVGCPKDPTSIATTVDVPRGRITFDPAFIEALRALMAGGSAPFPRLLTALSRRQADRPRIARSLLYLVAGGELAPFARPCAVADERPPTRFASATARLMVARLAASGGAGWIASPVTGAGVAMGAAEARSVLALLERRRGKIRLPRGGLARLVRLGILA